MKDIVSGSLLLESIFEITSEKAEKSVYYNPIFWEGCGNPTPPPPLLVLKGLKVLRSQTFAPPHYWLNNVANITL